ncbi:MAG: hypothetical protein GX103_11500 [Bacteroidales bacterium]|nr:hypothetical protein [Bacteroidales bacterium]MDD4739929.1 hypothetical protein [Bacteroidales bacterium]NLO51767.1 hypothetical protein [Bacteroidales bacterium]
MNSENLRNACADASTAMAKLNLDAHADLRAKLDYCIGSYDYDKNPEGLYQYGKATLDELKKFKAKNPRKVNKKIIDNLEQALKD